MSTADASAPKFLFTVCQAGAEVALRQELMSTWPNVRLAFSRPGFVTFKVPESMEPENIDLKSTFARTWGRSLGKVSGDDASALARQVWELAGESKLAHVHAWERDRCLPGDRGFEPGLTVLAQEIAGQIQAAAPSESPKLVVNSIAKAGQAVLDCVLVEPGEWWIGRHQATTAPTRWPGGVCPVEMPEHAVSRAYRKMQEALLWSELPISKDDVVAEIGCAPGGAAQMLLDCGVRVLGIDPAEVDDSVLAHPRFTHVRKRAADMKRREFAEVTWLLVDSNVAPKHTLDSVEGIVTHSRVHLRGMILTLKLLDEKLSAEIPAFLSRIRGWGYRDVRARQLSVNRREICVAATRSRARRRQR